MRRLVASAVLNSDLFFWFFTVHSDVRNLNRREVEAFPVDLDRLETVLYDIEISLTPETRLGTG